MGSHEVSTEEVILQVDILLRMWIDGRTGHGVCVLRKQASLLFGGYWQATSNGETKTGKVASAKNIWSTESRVDGSRCQVTSIRKTDTRTPH